MMRGTPRSRHRAATASTGWTKPNTLDTWLQITASTPGRIRRSKDSAAASGRNRGADAADTRAPRARRGRVTALCSYPEITALPPGGTRLLMAMFRAWVAFRVNTTRSGDGARYSSASSVRQSRAASAAAMAAGYPPRPGELMEARARTMASATDRGFWKVVAALSR